MTDAFSTALTLWRRYHQQTEDFDRTVCTRLDPDGTHTGRDGAAWPTTAEERRACTQHARRVLEVLKLELANVKGLTTDEELRARLASARERQFPPGHPRRLDLEPFPLAPACRSLLRRL